MSRIKVSIEQIIAGALLLNFDTISNVDITLLTEDILRKNPNCDFDSENYESISKYIKQEYFKISLKDELNMDSYIPENGSNLQKTLERIAGVHVRKYLENFNMEWYILRKIQFYSEIDGDIIDNLFCKKQQQEMDKINDKGYLTIYWKEDNKAIRLSDYGRLRLFKINNCKELEKFIEAIKPLRYHVNILDDFLIKQNLELPIHNILTIENLQQFCNNYGINLEPGTSNVYIKKI